MKADESHSEEYIRQSIDQGEGQWHEVNQGDKKLIKRLWSRRRQ